MSLMSEQTELRETVRARYAAAAIAVTEGGGGCCSGQAVEVDETFGATLYQTAQRDELPPKRSRPHSAAATPPRSPNSAKASGCSTSAPAAASTSCSPRAASVRRARLTAST
ncbi:hypothetical protein Lesp01_35840 [Lentzea sp. NBRC 102530]|nr:hypothetical protein Lesp01_35840 [Lentzea sp. NBRC 102530]